VSSANCAQHGGALLGWNLVEKGRDPLPELFVGGFQHVEHGHHALIEIVDAAQRAVAATRGGLDFGMGCSPFLFSLPPRWGKGWGWG
jgi:hypothetical protein